MWHTSPMPAALLSDLDHLDPGGDEGLDQDTARTAFSPCQRDRAPQAAARQAPADALRCLEREARPLGRAVEASARRVGDIAWRRRSIRAPAVPD